MARIAEAVLEDSNVNAVGLARQMGLNRFTVAKTIKKTQQAGG